MTKAEAIREVLKTVEMDTSAADIVKAVKNKFNIYVSQQHVYVTRHNVKKVPEPIVEQPNDLVDAITSAKELIKQAGGVDNALSLLSALQD
jgi:hypothetical protein